MTLLKAILCFALASAVYSHGPEHDSTVDCRKAEILFYSLCPRDPITRQTIRGAPGKRGAPGSKGDVGIGVQGPPAVVDYERVNSIIDQKLVQVFSEQNVKIAELTTSLARAEEERRALGVREGFCFVKYNGKYFWIETNYNEISCQRGREMCAARGGTPADIYSEDHYNMIKDYVRRQIRAGDRFLHLWLGMRFNVKTMTTSLSDGTPAPFLKWHPGFPRNATGWECFGFVVHVSHNVGNQDMLNFGTTRQGVLCQKDQYNDESKQDSFSAEEPN